MEYSEITYEVDSRVLTITLDRPDRLNAFTYRMHEELLDAFDRVDADDDVRVVVVTGRGRGFCAGVDLGEGGGTFDSQTPRPVNTGTRVAWSRCASSSARSP
ncbi:MAG: hypothetical protein QOC92_2075 [Acidimicrobiaceae bacterium]|jgi:enoyl-CoA hydratase/carnithine racemase